MSGSSIAPIKYSFSGADCKAYGYFDKNETNRYNQTSLTEEKPTDSAVKTVGRRATKIGLNALTNVVSTAGDTAAIALTGDDIGTIAAKGLDQAAKTLGYFSSNTSNKIVPINSLSTLSLSIHESKSPVRRLGHMVPVGYTRGIRTIAGSMVLTIVGNEHPLKDLSSVDPRSITYYSLDSDKGKNIVTKISPFNLLLMYNSEVNASVSSKIVIKGIDFITEGVVTSINDLVSEVVLQFVALDIEQFGANK
jgi:hypothetical protein